MLAVAYAPTRAGTVSEFATITDTMSGLISTRQLIGTAGTQMLVLSPTSLAFPARSVGTTSVPMNVTVTNTGSLPVTIASVALSGEVNSNFTESDTCGRNASLAAGAACAVSVSFSPGASGAQSATLPVLSNATNGPVTTVISGTAN